MFGDILSDLTSELSGSLGLAGSLNAGTHYAMGQAAHGSAPDIAGRDVANPMSLILSAGMLLGWCGQQKKSPKLLEASRAIDRAAEQVIREGQVTRDVGGNLGTQAAGMALAKSLQTV
jgi:3-isopropylmalate dehydrogenase